MGYYLRLLTGCLFILVNLTVSAQHAQPTDSLTCATPDLTKAQRQEFSKQAALALQIKQASGEAPTPITYVPIRPHIFRKSDGTGGMTMSKLNNIIAITNSYYLLNGTGIQFYFCGTSPDYIDNTSLYNSFPVSNETALNGRDALNALNQYYVNAFNVNGLGGYAYFPADSIQATRSFILNESDEVDLANRLIPHEVGHNFGLFHTFGNSGSGTDELVTRGNGANCITAGDQLCDTPADPYGLQGANTTYINGCQTYNGTATDAQGTPFSPSITNIMSYYFPCTHDFTPGQYGRMQQGLALRQTHVSYSLDCPETIVAAATSVTCSVSSGNVVVSWQDNAMNEMGYFIERSTSPNSGFVPIGGVAPNTTSFVDSKISFLTTYYYRIRPSNCVTQGMSAIVSIITPACRPTYGDYSCTVGDGLNGFVLNGITLSQNSGCSPGGYNSTTAVSATIVAGQTVVPFTGTLFNSQYLEGASVWVDLNRNGLFEANRNELLYQTPTTVTGQFSGSLTLPNGLLTGPLPVRVIVAYNTIPVDACGTYTYGETEDYVLTIVPKPADLSLSLQVNNRTPNTNQLVSFSLTLRNDGPGDATGVSWQNRLPASLSFVSGDASVQNSGTAVGGSNLSINSGASATFVYQLKPTQPGTYVNAAQVTASNQADPDSQPNSGTGDGQDDAATVDIRTPTSTTTVYASANPNQTPLPAVVSSQPTPGSATADLSLAMAVNARVPIPGQPVTFTITVSNAGSLSATSIVVRDTLRGLTLTSSPSGMSVVSSGSGYTIIEGTIASLSARGSAQLIFIATPTGSGYIRNAAQVWSVATPDPDSKPGSLTPSANNINGEDDVAWLDLRVGS